MTYQELVQLQKDIEKQSKQSPAFKIFNRLKIAAFNYDNKEALTLAKAKTDELMHAHVQLDAKGNWSAVTTNGQFVKWVYKSEADEEICKTKYDIFFKTEVAVII